MRFLRSRLGATAVVLGLCLVALLIENVISVDRVTRPPRELHAPLDFESMAISVEEVGFTANDGIELRGWWMQGDPSKPPLILCHDLGSSKLSLFNLAIDLHSTGFPVLLFDFRGHGESGGNRSGLGLTEKRDVLGALDWVADRADRAARIGVYGAGMGAHAAVLAASERRDLQVLVLDGLPPDAAFTLRREAYPKMVWARKSLGPLCNAIYFLLHGSLPDSERASDAVAQLSGRDLLMLAPAKDSVLADAMREMVASIPDQIDSDGNLVVLPATMADGLYGEQLSRYHQRVTEFFVERLPGEETIAAD